MNKIRIPRIVMQMSDDHNVPIKWINGPASIRDKLEGWRYVFLTKDICRDFVIKYFPDYLFYYDSFSYDIQRINMVCYMWMYKVGGVYISLNYELTKNIESLFYRGSHDAYFVSSDNNSKWYTNSFIATRPGCKIFLECLDAMKNIVPWWCLNKNSKILYTTGSGMLSRVLKNTIIPFNNINSYDIPTCSICNLNCEMPGAYVKRMGDESWDNWDTYFFNVLYCNWKMLSVAILIIIIITWIYLSTKRKPLKIYEKDPIKKLNTPITTKIVKPKKTINVIDMNGMEYL